VALKARQDPDITPEKSPSTPKLERKTKAGLRNCCAKENEFVFEIVL
jgi:hypothetical protein